MNNIIKRVGRDTYTVKYKKNTRLFTQEEAVELEKELNGLGI